MYRPEKPAASLDEAGRQSQRHGTPLGELLRRPAVGTLLEGAAPAAPVPRMPQRPWLPTQAAVARGATRTCRHRQRRHPTTLLSARPP